MRQSKSSVFKDSPLRSTVNASSLLYNLTILIFPLGIPLTTRGFFYFFTFNGASCLAILTHLRAAFADPGKIKEGMSPPFHSEYMQMKTCEKCVGKETWKPARAHHCRECGFCVFKMDHHCPWINNCVGYRNMKFFLQFVIYIFIASAYLSLMMFLSFYNLLTARNTRYHMQSPVSSSIKS